MTFLGGPVIDDVEHDDLAVLSGTKPGLSRIWHFIRHSPVFAVGIVIVLVAIALAIVGPVIAPYDPVKSTAAFNAAPSFHHLMGTDNTGLDVFSRVLAAPRIDVLVALASALISLGIGSLIGLGSSFGRGPLGAAVMRIADVVQSLPLFVLAMMLVVTSGQSLLGLLAVIAFLNVPVYIRLMRGQVLAIRERSYVEAARAAGVRESLVAIRHVYPNAISPCLVQASITMGWAIILTAGLSFVGAGVRPPTPEWGSMIAIGANQLEFGAWWSSVFPGAAMALTVFGFAAVGEGLGDLLRREG